MMYIIIDFFFMTEIKGPLSFILKYSVSRSFSAWFVMGYRGLVFFITGLPIELSSLG